ncbi:Hypothetical protein PFR_JS2_1822 [Propionibacterium freudenreichii]|nr:Hypothetical protein PFR_JS2_1822 [Propionibacterium freudenreichii]
MSSRSSRCSGSPPRMRGEHHERRHHCHLDGITPAYAGRTRATGRRRGARRDHPRVCGENRSTGHDASRPTGSPPRMRGERPDELQIIKVFGITPAYAGRTKLWTLARDTDRDHPRVCGENPSAFSEDSREAGSPPRMRGEQSLYYSNEFHYGITPAYAGRTQHCDPGLEVIQDHPRVCGENLALRDTDAQLFGSPPRMRGELVAQMDGHLDAGITPAYAGRT